MSDAIATIGDNNPPASATHDEAIRALEIEAEAYLTGADITDQKTADELGMLIGKVRMAELQADAARKAEKKPHDDAAAAVQATYKPILARAARVQKVGKQLLATWIAKVDEENKRLAAEARQEAARQQPPAQPKREDEGSPFDDVDAVSAIATDTVPYTASNGREYQMPAADAVAKLWKACEAELVSDMAFEALLAANEPWLMVQARTDLERMRATRGGG